MARLWVSRRQKSYDASLSEDEAQKINEVSQAPSSSSSSFYL